MKIHERYIKKSAELSGGGKPQLLCIIRQGGFTLIEMLTVAAIIAVLVAISIPVINSSLEKSQVTTDQANERAAKGVMLTEYLLAENTGGGSEPLYFDNAAGKWTETAPAPYGKCEQHQGYYLKGMISDLGVVEMVWTDGAEKFEQPHSEGYGSTSLAVPTRSYGDFSVQGLDLDNTVTFNDTTGILTVKNEAPVTISNKAGVSQTMHRILVTKDVSANITLKNVNIDTSKEAAYTAAFKIADDSTGNVTITLEGTNTLKSALSCAGLMKKDVGTNTNIGTLTIKGGGILEATGGNSSAGIGGGGSSGRNSSNITISGGTVTATGGGGNYGGAGIGGGAGGAGSNITISGGIVTAIGGSGTNGGGAGIGGGFHSNGDSAGIGCSNITINGGIVRATGGNYSAGIGGGAYGAGSGITISGGTVEAAGGDRGAGIGGGAGGAGSNITIKTSTVTATGKGGGADIGGGYNGSGNTITVNGSPYIPKRDNTINITPTDPPPATP